MTNVIDKKINYKKLFHHVISLSEFYKIDSKVLDHAYSRFVPWDAAIWLSCKKLGVRFERHYTQKGLVELLTEYRSESSYTQLAYSLGIPRSNCISLCNKILKKEKLNIPFLFSMGMGILIARLMNDNLILNLQQMLKILDIESLTQETKSNHDELLW